MNEIIGLFDGPTMNPAIILAVTSFVLGAVVMCGVCLLCRPCGCGKNGNKAESKNAKIGGRPFEKRKPHPAPTDGSVEIYVGNLSFETTEEQLRDLFAAYGTVSMCRLVVNKHNGKSKGFGFVQMPVRADAEKAIQEINHKIVQNREIKCNEAMNTI